MNPKKLYAISVFLILISGFILLKPTENTNILPPSPNTPPFILGAMSNWVDNYTNITDPNKFGMNLWHCYTGSVLDTNTSRWEPQELKKDSINTVLYFKKTY